MHPRVKVIMPRIKPRKEVVNEVAKNAMEPS